MRQYRRICRRFPGNFAPSLRANGSRECAPDDRLREAIQSRGMDCFVAEFIIGPAEGGTRWLLAMTTTAVGWVERSDTHAFRTVMGFAKGSTHPTLADLPPWQIKCGHWAAANQPDGQIISDFPKSCQAPKSKIFPFAPDPNQFTDSHRLVPTRGADRASSRNAGRDAVDAAASGEQQRAGRMTPKRTAKSCGSDAPMLASSLREEAQATVSNKPGHRGEREVSRKTIARGMPGRSGEPVVTMLVCLFFITHEAAGASCARHSLRPLFSGGANIRKTSGASRRENADAYPLGCLKIESKTAPERALRDRPARQPLRIELGIPVQIIEPAIVQIVRREQPAVAMQLVHRRCERGLPWKHPRLLRRQVSLAQIARRTGGDHVFPGGMAALAARDDVIEGEIVVGRAILADEAVAQEHVEPGEGGMRRRLDEGFQRHHARQLDLERGTAHRAVVMLNDVDAIEKHRLDRVLPRPKRQRIVTERPEVRIQHQYRPTALRNVRVQVTPPKHFPAKWNPV